MEEKLFIFEPDYDQLFYDPEEGYSYYDTIYLSAEKQIELNINIPGLQDWLNTYINEVLIPCAAGKITLEDLNKNFDWKSFHERGMEIAKEIKKQLPSNIRLQYRAPFEDKSGIIKDDIEV